MLLTNLSNDLAVCASCAASPALTSLLSATDFEVAKHTRVPGPACSILESRVPLCC